MRSVAPPDTNVPPMRLIASLLLILVGSAIVYWPSLRGGFIFDDFPNIVENPELRLSNLDAHSLWRAAHASPSTVLLRPLAMMSFALDAYFGQGLDPFRMKVTNLLIHLLNGVLLFGLLRSIVSLPQVARSRGDLLALSITAAWLFAPINFTGVAYIVQRMESLCQTFVLGGLWSYIAARGSQRLSGNGTARMWGALVLGTMGGMLAKESAVLLPLYAFIAEATLFGFRDDAGRLDRRPIGLFMTLAVLPGLMALFLALPHFLDPAAYAGREFTLWQRLLTESRVLVHYVLWTAIPNPGSLSFYHDDLPLSTDLLQPATTIGSLAFHVILIAGAVSARRTRPLVALGIFWFYAAHLLTATIIPLELVFEHRNYFASVGLLLALCDLLLPGSHQRSLRAARHMVLAACLVYYAGVTFLRALEWQDPVSFAITEAGKNPESPRAAYELGRTYTVLSHYDPHSALTARAVAELERAAAMPRGDCLADVGLIMLLGRTGEVIPTDHWRRLWNKLLRRPPSAAEVSALERMIRCSTDNLCKLPDGEVVNTLLAALTHKPTNVKILASLAKYLREAMGDTTRAITYTRNAIELSPGDPNLRRNLVFLLIDAGRIDEARVEYLAALDRFPDFEKDERFQALRRQ